MDPKGSGKLLPSAANKIKGKKPKGFVCYKVFFLLNQSVLNSKAEFFWWSARNRNKGVTPPPLSPPHKTCRNHIRIASIISVLKTTKAIDVVYFSFVISTLSIPRFFLEWILASEVFFFWVNLSLTRFFGGEFFISEVFSSEFVVHVRKIQLSSEKILCYKF